MTSFLHRLLLGTVSVLVLVPRLVQAQASTTFNIEKLGPPTSKEFTLKLSAADIKQQLGRVEHLSALPDTLAYFADHPVLTGFLTAYKEHRPIVLSPDMVWLLINQGFARHVANNADQLRAELVGFQGHRTLEVQAADIALGDPQANWEQVFPQFTQQIAAYSGSALTQALTSNFSTTTPVTRIASQVTIMEAVKPYFEYKVIMIGCGLPSVTLEGTPADWQQVLDKTRALTRYQLGWWTAELEPVLREFVKTAKGHGSHRFWMNMIKAHTEKRYGAPTVIDGWIGKFYPYTKKGERTDFKPIKRVADLPAENVEVPFKYVYQPTGEEVPMAFWAGFVGQHQDRATRAMRPEIAWAVLDKPGGTVSQLARMSELDDLSISNVTEVPADLYSLRRVGTLHLSFLRGIAVPAEVSHIEIGTLYLDGQLAAADEPALLARFPNTKVYINGVAKPTAR